MKERGQTVRAKDTAGEAARKQARGKSRQGEGRDPGRTALRVSAVSIAVNAALSLFKLAAGIVSGSGAMVSDAAHSASDVFSTLIVIAGVRLSGKDPDREHPYGHERLECVASLILAVLLFLTGLGIGAGGIRTAAAGILGEAAIEPPGRLALAAAAVSVGVKEWMYWYTRGAAREAGSGALMADAWHHRSDALSSVGAFAGILGARLGFPVLDPAASLVISLMIAWAAAGIFREAVDRMIDRACDEETAGRIRAAAARQDGVIRIDELRTRLFGARVYVDMEIRADGRLPLEEAHRIAESVHRAVEEEVQDVKHCMVRVTPEEEPERENAG